MPRSLASRLLAGAWAAFVSRRLTEPPEQSTTAENGDVIKVNRGAYDHYGVYVREGPRVIHYTGATGPADFNGMVRETSLKEFLNGAEGFTVCRFPQNPDERGQQHNVPMAQRSALGDAWQLIKQQKLQQYHLYSGDETVARARGELGKEGYNLVCNNCEHFAVWCKTGVRDSSQVNNILDILVALYERNRPSGKR